MIGLIIVGGKGTRLRPLSLARPKPVVPLVNRPFLYYQLDLLQKAGIREVIFCCGYMATQLADRLGDGADWGMRFHFVSEKVPLGTAGALKNAQPIIGNRREPLVVLNGDVLTDVDIKQIVSFHRERNAKATLTLVRVEDPTAYGVVVTDETGRVRSFLEKPSWQEVVTNTINAGIYVLDPEVVHSIPSGRNVSIEKETYPQLLDQDKAVYGFITEKYWLDIGTPPKYLRAHMDILRGSVQVRNDFTEVDSQIWVGSGVNIDAAAALEGPLFIGSNTSIQANARIRPFSVIGDGCQIGANSIVESSVIGKDSFLSSDCKVNWSVLDERVRLEKNCSLKGTVLAAGSHIAAFSKLTGRL